LCPRAFVAKINRKYFNEDRMPLKSPITAIFDIGKTNKKFLLFDKDYSIVYENKIRIEETEDDDGYPADNLGKITEWVMHEFDKVVSGNQFRVETLNISTYGATMVHLDEEGKPVTPLYNYLKPYPAELAAHFYQSYGGEETFSLETASPPMGMLNSGLRLYWLKHQKPQLFKRIKQSLHLPQYIAALFTGKAASEMTSIGCHTAMWNFSTNGYHRWLEEEELKKLLPPIQPVHKVEKIQYKNHILEAGIGIHDSSAALAPYLAAFDEPFIQLSTGTWSIAMNPFTQDMLTYEELAKDCLHYMTIDGNPVKASRFFLGSEFDHQMKRLGSRFFNTTEQKECEAEINLLSKIAKERNRNRALVLETAHQSGPYQHHEPKRWDITQFASFKEAYHQLMMDLVSIQKDSVNLAKGTSNIKQVIVTGGFIHNEFFTRLLATFLPDTNVYRTSSSHASALGAALVVNPVGVNREDVKKLLGLELQKPYASLNPDGYSWAELKT